MDNIEKMMSTFSNLDYKFEPLMPDKYKGIIDDDTVYLNPRQTKTQLASTVAEEIGHYLTSAGNILDQDSPETKKQERKARDVGATLVVTPENILRCYENGYETIEGCADFLGITKETFMNAINYYRRKDGAIMTKNKDVIVFNIDNTIKVYKNEEY